MSSNSSSHTIFIDDADTSNIQYRVIQLGPYRGKGFTLYSGVTTDDKVGPIYDGTLSATVVGDVSAAVTFTGTRVSVYGSLRPPLQTDIALPLTKYSIPEWDYEGVPAMVPYQAPNVTTPQNDVDFFTSDILPYGTYTLTINVTTASPSAPFYLDYIAVEVPGPAPYGSSLFPSVQSTASSTPTSLPVAAFIPQSHHPTRAVVGGVLAGVLGVIGALFVFFCYFKQKRRMMLPEYNYGKCTVAEKDVAPHVVPFTDTEQGISMARPDDLGLMFVSARSSMGSQPSSSSRPDSDLPPSAAYYYSLATTPPSSMSPPGSHYMSSPALSPSPFDQVGTRVLTHGKRLLSAATGSGNPADRSSMRSFAMDDVPPSVSVNRVDEIPEDEEIPPMYSRMPLPGEGCGADNVLGVNDAVDQITAGADSG